MYPFAQPFCFAYPVVDLKSRSLSLLGKLSITKINLVCQCSMILPLLYMVQDRDQTVLACGYPIVSAPDGKVFFFPWNGLGTIVESQLTLDTQAYICTVNYTLLTDLFVLALDGSILSL